MWTIAVVLVVLWLLGLVSGYTMGNFIHVALVIAIIAILVQVEDDCGDFGRGRTRVRHSKRKEDSRARKVLPKPAILSRKEVSRPIISTQAYRAE